MPKQPDIILKPQLSLFFKIVTGILVGVYLLNCLTPLRLHVDMLRYYNIKECIEFGCPPDSEAAKDYLPYGYTVLLLLLSKLGILKSFTIVLINCIYLFAALYLLKKMFAATLQPFFFLIVVLLSWTIIKFVVHPLSELQYLFFSIASLYFYQQYSDTKKILPLLLAFIFGIIGFLTRTVGITLIAALIVSLIWGYRKQLILLIRKNRILIAVIILSAIGVIIFSKQLGLNHYRGVMSKQFQEGKSFGQIIQWHFTEWAEILLNTSVAKAINYFPPGIGKIFFIILGVLLFAGFLFILFRRRNNLPFVVKAYLLCYSLLIFNWPFYDPRFWVPIIPLIAIIITQTIFFDKSKPLKTVLSSMFIVYALLGVFAIGFITYTSLNKRSLARTQANGVYRNEYETHFFGKPQSDTARHIDASALHILQKYD